MSWMATPFLLPLSAYLHVGLGFFGSFVIKTVFCINNLIHVYSLIVSYASLTFYLS